MPDDTPAPWDAFLIFFGVLFALCAVGELVILGVAYFTADQVECNWLWCKFTTVRSVGRTEVTRTETCTQNGLPINCSALEAWNFSGG